MAQSAWSKVGKVIDCNMGGDFPPSDWRRKVIVLFLDETKGTGDYYYAYRVEQMTDGSAIYLVRPTFKRGLDYLLLLADSRGSVIAPKFDDLENDLREKKLRFPELYQRLHSALMQVHAGKDPDRVLAGLKDDLSAFSSGGMPIETLLKVAKWLFIDEDVKYWGQRGRDEWRDSLQQLVAP
jgi:hypothetical protein